MEQPNYLVLLDGRTVGPYDRKTIVGIALVIALVLLVLLVPRTY